MNKINLKSSNENLEHRIELLTLLFNKAEEKVKHADTFRQKNMNYSLVTFGALITLGLKFNDINYRLIISGTLFVLMVIFCLWDRRWHKTKHGWDYSGQVYYQKMEELVNDPTKDISFKSYYEEGEKTAERFKFQPSVFYFLIVASVISFYLFNAKCILP